MHNAPMSGDDSPLQSDPLAEAGDFVAPFDVGSDHAVRGRIVRLDGVVSDILSAHAYPVPVARLLAEVVLLATLIGASLKFEGRLILQVTGEGPVTLLVVEYQTKGAVRGYARVDQDRYAALDYAGGAPSPQTMLGTGALAMTIDPGAGMEQYQSIVALEDDGIAKAAERYFEQSEQVPTRVALAVGEALSGDNSQSWTAGGALIQRMAGDAARGATEEAWNRAAILFDTVTPAELADPDMSAGVVLYRLFHEDGVRVEPPRAITKHCPCTRAYMETVLSRFGSEQLQDMREDDGLVHMTCEFCSRTEQFDVA